MRENLLSLDAVAFSPPYPNPAPTDAVGELAWIDIDDLFIDPRYQRPVGARGERNIKQVIENFSWNLFSPLVVARREKGCYAVIDGQHRAIAARTHGGIKQVPCLIINGDPSDEAKAFSVINGAVTAISETQIWHARLIAGDVDAIRLNRVLESVGVTILRSTQNTNNMHKGETLAIGALQTSFKTHGGGILALALRTIVDTRDGNSGYIRSPIIKATCAVLGTHPLWYADPEGVLRAIRKVGIKYLFDMAERRRVEKTITFHAAYSAELEKVIKEVLGNG